MSSLAAARPGAPSGASGPSLTCHAHYLKRRDHVEGAAAAYCGVMCSVGEQMGKRNRTAPQQ